MSNINAMKDNDIIKRLKEMNKDNHLKQDMTEDLLGIVKKYTDKGVNVKRVLHVMADFIDSVSQEPKY